MLIEKNVCLQAHNTFGIAARAHTLVHVRSVQDVMQLLADPVLRAQPKFVLGGGSNVVLNSSIQPVVLKVQIMGKRLLTETAKAWIVEAGAGESWHDLVTWTVQNGYPGLENMALIPGTVGAAPVQNIGAYGVELQDRFESLDIIDLSQGQCRALRAWDCHFGYRDSVFKHELAGKALITHVRLALPKPHQPVLGYADIEKKMLQAAVENPSPLQIYEWVCAIRQTKLPDLKVLGNAGSFFKNPTVTHQQCSQIIAREPRIVHYPLPDGSIKLAAASLIEACGWKGKTKGRAGVYEKQALVLVNHGGATGAEVMALAQAIQTSVHEHFGVELESEPVLV